MSNRLGRLLVAFCGRSNKLVGSGIALTVLLFITFTVRHPEADECGLKHKPDSSQPTQTSGAVAGHVTGHGGGEVGEGVEDAAENDATLQSNCSPLSIACLAESAGPLPKWTRSQDSLHSRRHHVLLAGHSRLRQVYEAMVSLLPAVRRTRADPLPPLADREPQLSLLQSSPRRMPLLETSLPASNDTCLARYLRKDGRHGRHEHWCSRAANWGALLLDFRWRAHSAEDLISLLVRLQAHPPQQLVVTFGLYQALNSQQLQQMRYQLPQLSERLRQLQQRGVGVVWMLEQAYNERTALGNMAMRQAMMNVWNTMTQEAMMAAGVPLWSAHLALMQDYLLRVCRGVGQKIEPLKRTYTDQETTPLGATTYGDAEDTREKCQWEQLHVDRATAARLAAQLMRYIDSGTGLTRGSDNVVQ